MLQQFLDSGLISVTNEEYFKKLKTCADELGETLMKDKAKLQNVALTTIDPKIPASDVVVVEVKKQITDNWSTFTSNVHDTPIPYIRAVMLEAIHQATKDNIENACLVWLTVQNLLRYMVITGKEKELLELFFTQMANAVESYAQQKWSLLEAAKNDNPEVKLSPVKALSLDSAKLEAHLKAATKNPDNNQHLLTVPGNYNTQNVMIHGGWADVFSKRSTQGIAEEVNKVIDALTKDINKNQSSIKEAVNTLLNKAQKEIMEKNALLQIRTQLLWWKEANYSAILKKSYHEVQSPLLEMALATDYAAYIPLPYPVSVDYFLKETHKKHASSNKSLSEVLTDIENNKEAWRSFFVDPTLPDGRISLLTFIHGLVYAKCSAQQLQERVGISGDSNLKQDELALWLLHDIQSLKLIQNK